MTKRGLGLIDDTNDNDLRAVDRRAGPPGSMAHIYVAGVVVLCLLGVGGIIALTLMQPGNNHTSTITIMLGFLVPVVTALLAGAVSQVQKSVNGRLTQLLAMTARTHQAEGELTARNRARDRRETDVDPGRPLPVIVVNEPPSPGDDTGRPVPVVVVPAAALDEPVDPHR